MKSRMGIWIRLQMNTLIICIVMGIISPANIRAQDTKKDILILHSYHKNFNWTDEIQEGIESVLDPEKNDLYIEYMDTYRNKEQDYEKQFHDLLAYKYKDRKFDIVICSDNAAFDFFIQYQEELFSNIPMVFVGVNNFKEEQLAGNENITGIPERASLMDTVKLAIRLHPNAKQIVCYGTDTVTYEAVKKDFQREIQNNSESIPIVFVENFTMQETIEQVKKLPRDTIIMPLSVMKDEEGNLITYEEVGEILSKATNLPMYSFGDFFLDHGIIGGKLVNGYKQGKAAGEMAFHILNGEHIKNVPILTEGLANYMFDYNKLKEYHIEQKMLPKGSQISNVPSAVYRIDKQLVWGIAVLIILLIIFLIVLVTNIIARKKAQGEAQTVKNDLQESYMELEATHEELLASEEELNRQYVEIQESREELRISKERYKLAVSGSYDGIWDWNFKNNSIFISTRGKEILGLPEDQRFFKAKELLRRVPSSDRKKVLQLFNQHLKGQTEFYELEHLAQMKDGVYHWINCRGRAIWDEEGTPTRIAGSISNIDEHKKAEEQIYQLAYYDELTKLPNRTLFFNKLNKLLKNRDHKIVGLMFIDLDNFKNINDSMGHTYGDLLLQEVAELLQGSLGKNDICARLGGDEFALILRNSRSVDEITQKAAELLQAFDKPFILNKREFFVTMSIGIAVGPKDGEDAETLLKNADAAMYSAKGAGKNNFKLYDEILNQHILFRLEVENDLRKALERDEFILYYQPQVELPTGRIVGGEALIRWIHPQKGLVSPIDFIPVAEETGLIIPIGEWVLRTACKQVKEWQDMGSGLQYVAVNLSARQFQDPNLVGIVRDILKETGLDPQYLELEITETIAIENIDYAIQVLRELQELGVTISLDDFGTGYSSMNYLKRLPISRVKIDKSFTQDIMGVRNEREIIRAVITLAHANRLEVIAEGVETKEQLEFLQGEKCDKAQGYLFSRPIPAQEIESIIKKDERIL